jgi:type VI secretion system protein ImpE
MEAREYLREGRLDEALQAVQEQVRKEPAVVRHRVYLFQLLSVLGQWGRALNQLQLIGEMDAGALSMVQTYRETLQCETLRSEVFAGKRTPLVFGEPAPWLALFLQALQHTAAGRHQAAQATRAQALDQVETTAGRLDGSEFLWLADADSRLGPVVEAIVNGHYYWIPFDRISQIRLEAPEDLRDMVWMPAYFTWANGGKAAGFIPTRYPQSEASGDPLLALARKTCWTDNGSEEYVGSGQRMLATDTGEFPLMAIREIILQVTEEEPETQAGGNG